jgi:transposase InsO family protein
MRGNVHVRFGGRAGETDRAKARHRAPTRPDTEHPTRALVLNALGMAIRRRNGNDGLVIHSDRGVQTEFNWWWQHLDLGGVGWVGQLDGWLN